MKAVFIDCYLKENEIVLWLKKGKKNIKVIDNFIPELYISGSDLKQKKFKLKKNRIFSYFKKKKGFYLGKEVFVLAIPVRRLSQYHFIRRDIERILNFDLELYNADQKIEELYMFERDIFPTSEVEVELDCDRVNGPRAKSIKNIDDSNRINYKIPKFVSTQIQVATEESLSKTLDTKLTKIRIDKKKFVGSEKKILLGLKKKFLEIDPDIIWTENGNVIIPYLRERFELHEIDFNFNRFEVDDFSYEKGQVYHTYGNIIYRAASIFLKGRLLFDSRSFFADDTGFYGIIDGSRVCRQRIHRTSMRSAGAGVTNLLLYKSYRENFLLPYKIGMYERFKTLEELYYADRGPVIFEPRVGFHTDVCEFDFVSLYPQVMWKHNLSPETLFCKCCKEQVPGLHYNFCEKRRGVVSIVAEDLIKRRIALKKIGNDEAMEKSSYLKWLLVTMFGYQAFKNRKIGTIEIHESIQAYAREIIMQTVRIAESLGWEVVHGIVDGVYAKKKNYTKEDLKVLHKKIIEETGFIINLEGCYKWIVFLPSINNINQPVSNHFYGIFKDGKIKCRGIELRRRDTPKIISDMQSEMIDLLDLANNEKEFVSRIPSSFKILRRYVKKLDKVDAKELKIVKKISKTEYSSNIAQKIILFQLEKEGWENHPGQKIEYIIRDVKNSNPYKRYIKADLYDGNFDKKKYIEMMVKATANLFQPFGVTERDVWEKLNLERQKKLVFG